MIAMVIVKGARLLLIAVAASYAILAALGPWLAPKLLYHPDYGSTRVPEGLRRLRGADGLETLVVHLPHPGAAFTLWYFHGTAETLGDIEPLLREYHEAGFAVFAVEYPGYGLSPGQPSESAIFAANRTARAFLRDKLKVPAAQTILVGHSLGGGSAVQLATEEEVGGLVLQSAFTSAYEVMTRWPILPFDQYENRRKLRQVSSPVLILHGDADDVISPRHGQALFAAAAEPKRALWVPAAGHNDLRFVARKKYWDAFSAFRDLCARSSPRTP